MGVWKSLVMLLQDLFLLFCNGLPSLHVSMEWSLANVVTVFKKEDQACQSPFSGKIMQLLTFTEKHLRDNTIFGYSRVHEEKVLTKLNFL